MPSLAPPTFQLQASTTGNAPVQRMMRNNYPWSGVVNKTPSLALRTSPDSSGYENILADIPRNVNVTVLSDAGGGWINIEVDASMSGLVLNQQGRSAIAGGKVRGVVAHRYIDDATANAMGNMVGETARWLPAPGAQNDFTQWAQSSTGNAVNRPSMNGTDTINCWEVILLAALEQGLIDHAYVNRIYSSGMSTWISQMTRGAQQTYDPVNGVVPTRGDIVFFDGLAHVALSAGGDQIYSFWPNSQTPGGGVQPANLNGDGIQDNIDGDGVGDMTWGEFRFSGRTRSPLPSPDAVEQVSIAHMKGRMDPTTVVTFAPPAW